MKRQTYMVPNPRPLPSHPITLYSTLPTHSTRDTTYGRYMYSMAPPVQFVTWQKKDKFPCSPGNDISVHTKQPGQPLTKAWLGRLFILKRRIDLHAARKSPHKRRHGLSALWTGQWGRGEAVGHRRIELNSEKLQQGVRCGGFWSSGLVFCPSLFGGVRFKFSVLESFVLCFAFFFLVIGTEL